jgi:hypothetical protein
MEERLLRLSTVLVDRFLDAVLNRLPPRSSILQLV